MIVPTTIDLNLFLGVLLSLPFILGYMPRQSYDPPPPPPPDRRSPEEKEFDRMIKTLESEIERLTRLRDAHLWQKKSEDDLKRAVSSLDIIKSIN